jgi:hypothetical protein
VSTIRGWSVYHKKELVIFSSVAAKIGSALELDLSLYFLQTQKGPTDLFKGFPGNP